MNTCKLSPIIVRHAEKRAVLPPNFGSQMAQTRGNTNTTMCPIKMPTHKISDGLKPWRTLLDDRGHKGDFCSP